MCTHFLVCCCFGDLNTISGCCVVLIVVVGFVASVSFFTFFFGDFQFCFVGVICFDQYCSNLYEFVLWVSGIIS